MATDADNKEWRGKVDEELSDLKAATKTLTSVVDTLVNRIAGFEQKLDAVSGGPNIAQWSGWGVGIGGLLWVLITGQITGIENGASAERTAMSELLVQHEIRLGKANDRLIDRARWMGSVDEKFNRIDKHIDGMWSEVVKLRDELHTRTDRLARLESFTERQNASNERQQDRLDQLDRSASIDKDQLERDAFEEIRSRLDRVEEGIRRNFFKREGP